MSLPYDRDYPAFDGREPDPWQDPYGPAPGDDEAYRISGDGVPGTHDAPYYPPADYIPTWYPSAPADPEPAATIYPYSIEGAPLPTPGHAPYPGDPAAGPVHDPYAPPPAAPYAPQHHAPAPQPVPPAPSMLPVPAPVPQPQPSERPLRRWVRPARPEVPAWQPLSQAGLAAVPAPAPPAMAMAPPAPIGPARKPLYPPPTPTEPKKALHDALEVMRRGKWLFLLFFGLTLGGVGYYTHTRPSEYEAGTLLLIDTSSEPVSERLPFDGGEVGAFENRNISNQAMILGQSLLLAERTAGRLMEIERVPETGRPLSLLAEDGQPLSKAELAKRLQEQYVTVEPASSKADADGIWVYAAGPDAAEAALVANLFAEEYVTLARETGQKHVVASRTFLEEQIERRKAELLDLEQQIKDYRSREGAVSLPDETQRSIMQVAQLEAGLDQAEIDVRMHQASLASLEEQLRQLQPQLTRRMASGVELELVQVQQEIVRLEDRVALIYEKNPELRFGGANADLEADNARIAQLRARAQQLSEQYVDEVYAAGGLDPRAGEGGLAQVSELKRKMADERVALSGAEARVAALRERLGGYNRRLDAIPAHAMQLAQLERTRQSTEQLYLSLVQKLQEARIAEESQVGFAQVIRPATPPEEPARPNKPLGLALGAVLGLLLGLGAAVGRHKLDTRLYTPNDLRARGLAVLGVIPDLRRHIRKEFGRQKRVPYAWHDVSTTLMSLVSPRSPVAEAYRRLHTSLEFAPAGSGPAQTVLVTSAEMGAGKSVTALNLAVTAAQAGQRTLVIDADMHRPALEGYLGYMPSPDLSLMVLERRARVSIDHFATGVPNLYALTLRDHTAIPAELLGSARMRDLVDRLRGVFDLIVFDSPPALVATDAALLAAACDATLVVAASAQTKAEEVKETLEELGRVGANVVGVVLNRFDSTRIYGYKSAYRNRYRYHDQSRSLHRA